MQIRGILDDPVFGAILNIPQLILSPADSTGRSDLAEVLIRLILPVLGKDY
ncbi:MAG: hypothetical protein WA510_15380 [Acidobacteriaceae bacterium]|jgi:hypothetical protein